MIAAFVHGVHFIVLALAVQYCKFLLKNGKFESIRQLKNVDLLKLYRI